MTDHRLYYYFYLIGRDSDDSDLRIDLAEIAKRVLDGHAMFVECTAAATAALRHLEIDGTMHRWYERNKDEIAEAGGDRRRAWDLYLQGRLESLAREIEYGVQGEIVDVLDAIDAGDDVDDDAKDDEDDDDDWDVHKTEVTLEGDDEEPTREQSPSE